jgi:hypothetical protein
VTAKLQASGLMQYAYYGELTATTLMSQVQNKLKTPFEGGGGWGVLPPLKLQSVGVQHGCN